MQRRFPVMKVRNMFKKVFLSFVLVCFVNNNVFAECNFTTGIKETERGTFEYTKDCHIKVGEIKRDLDIANQQVEKLTKAIELKDLAISKADQRVNLWMDTTYKLEDRLNKIDDLQSKNMLLYFGAGVILTSLAVWGAGHLK